MERPQLYLASTSPRRQELLQQIGIKFEVLKVAVDETVLANEAPAVYVQRIARAKASAGWASLLPEQMLPVLSADTAVVINGQILGKPLNQEHGMAMLQQLSGRVHEVLTAVTVQHQQSITTRLVTTEVEFGSLTDAQITNYWMTGEPADKAGGYAIQGLAAIFVKRLSGSYSSVVGLPLYEVAELLRLVGVW